jgi:hypothetical protein
VCSDQSGNSGFPVQRDVATGIQNGDPCPNVGDGRAMGSGVENCSPSISGSLSGFCCTRNGQVVNTPVSGSALTVIHARAVGTLKEATVTHSQTVQVRLA